MVRKTGKSRTNEKASPTQLITQAQENQIKRMVASLSLSITGIPLKDTGLDGPQDEKDDNRYVEIFGCHTNQTHGAHLRVFLQKSVGPIGRRIDQLIQLPALWNRYKKNSPMYVSHSSIYLL